MILYFNNIKKVNNMNKINKRIKKEIDLSIIEKLKDENLIEEYKNCKSVNNKILQLQTILNKYIDTDINLKIINEYFINLIPPGTKSCIRGNKFNKYIKEYLLKLNLDSDIYELKFETKCKYVSEIPDWYTNCI